MLHTIKYLTGYKIEATDGEIGRVKEIYFDDSTWNIRYADERMIKGSGNIDAQNEQDEHLRSSSRVTGYHIRATDGDIGHVHDFIVDDQAWYISQVVIATHNWIGGKKVLVPVFHIQKIQWEDSKVYIDMTIDSIKIISEFDESESFAILS